MNERILQELSDSFVKLLIPGIRVTIPLTAISFSLGLILALTVALIEIARIPVLNQAVRCYVWIIRTTPMIVQLFVVYYGLPNVGIKLDAFPSAILVFTLSVGAYCSETIRAAILSVSSGQMEAAYCVGMNYLQAMWHIVLPQAFRTAFPALSNSIIGMVKDTSLASNITVTEMFLATRQIAGRTYQFLPLYLEVAFVYLIFSTVMTWIQRWGEKKLSRYEGRQPVAARRKRS